jgi:hypothetical protein
LAFLPESFAALEVCGTRNGVEHVLCRELTVGFAGSASARDKKVFTLKIRCDSFCVAGSAAVWSLSEWRPGATGWCLYKKAGFRGISADVDDRRNHPATRRERAVMGALLAHRTL